MIFLCDVMLGKLAKYLRILGLNTIYITSAAELDGYKDEYNSPLFFTKRKVQKISYSRCIYIESNDVLDQLTEIKAVIKPYIDTKTLMKRCIRCNTLLEDAKKNDIEGLVPEFIFHTYSIFKTCPHCRKVYWEGSHVEHMVKWVQEIIQ
jgi:uncharacterized protein